MATHWLRGPSLALILVLSLPATTRAQTTPPPTGTNTGGTQSSSTTKEVQTPISTPNFDRIRDALNRKPAINLDDGRVRFYVQITAKWPTFQELAEGYDLRYGPTARGNPMTHQEFLNLVTPKEMYGSAGIRASEVLQMALVNAIGQLIVKRGLEAIAKARDEREKQAIREQIERELAALRGGK